MTASKFQINENLAVYNYAICFLDILGQRALFRDDGWLPTPATEENRKQFYATKVRPTVGSVIALQQRAHDMIASVIESRPDAPLRMRLSPDQRPAWDEMQRTNVKTQYWSDGLICYAALGDPSIRCRMNAMYGLFGMAGAVILMGLADGHPIRGAIDGAWATEIRDHELYGPAIAQAYELESTVAQWPRIVISERIVQMLIDHRNAKGEDVFTRMDRALADLCLKMVGRDLDGVSILHYLGDEFTNSVTQKVAPELHASALKFVENELTKFRASPNKKLALRYAQLQMYFKANARK